MRLTSVFSTLASHFVPGPTGGTTSFTGSPGPREPEHPTQAQPSQAYGPSPGASLSLSDDPNSNALKDTYDYSYHWARLC